MLPPAEVVARAMQLGALITARPRSSRRLTHAVVARTWQRRVVEDLRASYAHQLLAALRH
ncbi:MAG: hypothetical protein ACRCY9_23065 [Phycicoccus sp.]